MASAREQMPSRWALFVVTATAVALLAPPSAAGQPTMSDCYGGDPAKQIANCTRIISHPKSDRDDRATAYVYRARLYEGAGDWDKAVDDYTNSIGLDPSDPDVFFTRGRALANKGAFVNAIADTARR